MKQISGKNVILIGFMGAGKTEVGRRLASALNRRFIDSDQWIEESAGKTISQIFSDSGEAFFRRLETEAIAELTGQKGLVLSTGGGCILNPQNVQMLRKNGIVIWLEADIDALHERLAGDKKRPLLSGNTDLAGLYRKREPLYRAACHVRVDTTGKSPLMVSEEIMAVLQEDLFVN